MNRLSSLLDPASIDLERPVCLYDEPNHGVYWVGSQEDTPFRCNAYLIVDGDVRVLFDPGSSMHHFAQVRQRVAAIVPPESVSHVVVHHQDPDLCDSLPDWLAVNPELVIVATPRTRVLLPYYGFSHDVRWLDVSPNDSTVIELPSGRVLAFLVAPFLHFPEACVTFDEASGFLLSGDVGAAVEKDWQLVVTDFERHLRTMIPFHIFYMASQRALRGFIDKIRPFPIQAIAPQHGSIIGEAHVTRALDALSELRCGIDLVYPRHNLEEAMSDFLRD